MNPDAATADAAVLIAAILMLLAIVGKLITANLTQRSKKSSAVLEARRKDIGSRLKEVQLKRTSARGTLEFWERRRSETELRVFDMRRDVEAYVEQLGPLEGAEEYVDDDDPDQGGEQEGGFFSPTAEEGDESTDSAPEEILEEPADAESPTDAIEVETSDLTPAETDEAEG
ncbi:MAG: hypothetical protein HOM68_19600 [Gemmatimonadetes bacterium]|jgi:hypothetical protein|nr:hypothetical protein [Gemmatimonadota bacterium]MBT5058757.1 hypothetical protein [Gemmatimonadota bacterium]MBT5144286.1 hypothetical protein [Gemmatimonadota bacterium]MBT5588688.1 hypothetical protein [Gemmatimonadota bacterium]MBT5964594.1 hypothetical protein [Gemmatimonadota bacterium]